MSKISDQAFRIVGFFSIISGVFGLFSDGIDTLISSFVPDEMSGTPPPEYYPYARWIMLVVCVFFYLGLIWYGVKLVKVRSAAVWPFVMIVAGELVFILLLIVATNHPVYGSSIAAAFGVALGGMTVQLFTLFPLWAPLVLFFARERVQREPHKLT